MAVERHEVFGGKIAGNGDAEREHEGVPVGSEGLAGIADVRDAADVGGENRHAHYPAGDAVSGRRELVGGAALLEERTAEHHHAQREDEEYYKVNDVHNSEVFDDNELRELNEIGFYSFHSHDSL